VDEYLKHSRSRVGVAASSPPDSVEQLPLVDPALGELSADIQPHRRRLDPCPRHGAPDRVNVELADMTRKPTASNVQEISHNLWT
jgi:hypothetical protein